jgi:hypothetical protein
MTNLANDTLALALRYNLRTVFAENPNAAMAFEGSTRDGAHIKVEYFPPNLGGDWVHISVAFGQVFNVWENRTPLGSEGIVEIACTRGSLQRGRLACIAPMSRTLVHEEERCCCPDMIAYALAMRGADFFTKYGKRPTAQFAGTLENGEALREGWGELPPPKPEGIRGGLVDF